MRRCARRACCRARRWWPASAFCSPQRMRHERFRRAGVAAMMSPHVGAVRRVAGAGRIAGQRATARWVRAHRPATRAARRATRPAGRVRHRQWCGGRCRSSRSSAHSGSTPDHGRRLSGATHADVRRHGAGADLRAAARAGSARSCSPRPPALGLLAMATSLIGLAARQPHAGQPRPPRLPTALASVVAGTAAARHAGATR